MAGLILSRAFEPGVGMCHVEHVAGDWFRLIPDRNPLKRILKPRAAIRWRPAKTNQTPKKENAQ